MERESGDHLRRFLDRYLERELELAGRRLVLLILRLELEFQLRVEQGYQRLEREYLLRLEQQRLAANRLAQVLRAVHLIKKKDAKDYEFKESKMNPLTSGCWCCESTSRFWVRSCWFAGCRCSAFRRWSGTFDRRAGSFGRWS